LRIFAANRIELIADSEAATAPSRRSPAGGKD